MSGVSLIEMLMAAAILASAILVILTIVPRTYASLRQGREYTVAAHLAQRVLEDHKNRPFSQLQSDLPRQGQFPAFTVINGNGSHVSYDYSVSLAPPPSDCDPSRAQGLHVVVTWSSGATGIASRVDRRVEAQTLVRLGN